MSESFVHFSILMIYCSMFAPCELLPLHTHELYVDTNKHELIMQEINDNI